MITPKNTSENQAYTELEAVFLRYYYLESIRRHLHWDRDTYMPVAGYQLRAQQLSVIETIQVELLQKKQTALWLDHAEANTVDLSPQQHINLQSMRFIQRLKTAVPIPLQKKLRLAIAESEFAYAKAKQDDAFPHFIKPFSQLLRLLQEKAQHLGAAFAMSPYDGLLQEFDPGNKQANFAGKFEYLQGVLPQLMQDIVAKQADTPDAPHKLSLPVAQQKRLCREILLDLGFDFNHGRLDSSAHPFTEGNKYDVRLTSHFRRDDLMFGILAMMHEAGHALYDAHLPATWHEQPLGYDMGMLVHEAMALFYENCLTRSPGFISYFVAKLREYGVDASATDLHTALLWVKPGVIRIEADEVTYLLHIMLRHQLECQLLADELKPEELPAAWAEHHQRLLHCQPLNDRDGCLQDPHWAVGSFGYFPSYGQGAIVSSNLYARQFSACLSKVTCLDREALQEILAHLNTLIFSRGASQTISELLVTSDDDLLSAENYLDYLSAKYLGCAK